MLIDVGVLLEQLRQRRQDLVTRIRVYRIDQTVENAMSSAREHDFGSIEDVAKQSQCLAADLAALVELSSTIRATMGLLTNTVAGVGR